jgi:alkanesulfonate monooxygenase SsuD/methylene tetrahydromethanopterin reductase-like flavin-dependent oxidoreductase (luciferase family)
VVFVFFSVGSNRTQVRESIKALFAYCLAGCLAAPALFEPNGMLEELRDLFEGGGVEAVQSAMPEQWLDEFAVVGEADECAGKIRRFFEAGATSVILYPVPPTDAERMITLAATEVLPRI